MADYASDYTKPGLYFVPTEASDIRFRVLASKWPTVGTLTWLSTESAPFLSPGDAEHLSKCIFNLRLVKRPIGAPRGICGNVIVEDPSPHVWLPLVLPLTMQKETVVVVFVCKSGGLSDRLSKLVHRPKAFNTLVEREYTFTLQLPHVLSAPFAHAKDCKYEKEGHPGCVCNNTNDIDCMGFHCTVNGQKVAPKRTSMVGHHILAREHHDRACLYLYDGDPRSPLVGHPGCTCPATGQLGTCQAAQCPLSLEETNKRQAREDEFLQQILFTEAQSLQRSIDEEQVRIQTAHEQALLSSSSATVVAHEEDLEWIYG